MLCLEEAFDSYSEQTSNNDKAQALKPVTVSFLPWWEMLILVARIVGVFTTFTKTWTSYLERLVQHALSLPRVFVAGTKPPSFNVIFATNSSSWSGVRPLNPTVVLTGMITPISFVVTETLTTEFSLRLKLVRPKEDGIIEPSSSRSIDWPVKEKILRHCQRKL